MGSDYEGVTLLPNSTDPDRNFDYTLVVKSKVESAETEKYEGYLLPLRGEVS